MKDLGDKWNDAQGFIDRCRKMAAQCAAKLRHTKSPDGQRIFALASTSMSQGNWKQAMKLMEKVMGETGQTTKSGGDVMSSPDWMGEMMDRAEARLEKGAPGGGWMAIPGGKHGGFRKRAGNKWVYWYPGGGAMQQAVAHHNKRADHHDKLGNTGRSEMHDEVADGSARAATGGDKPWHGKRPGEGDSPKRKTARRRRAEAKAPGARSDTPGTARWANPRTNRKAQRKEWEAKVAKKLGMSRAKLLREHGDKLADLFVEGKTHGRAATALVGSGTSGGESVKETKEAMAAPAAAPKERASGAGRGVRAQKRNAWEKKVAKKMGMSRAKMMREHGDKVNDLFVAGKTHGRAANAIMGGGAEGGSSPEAPAEAAAPAPMAEAPKGAGGETGGTRAKRGTAEYSRGARGQKRNAWEKKVAANLGMSVAKMRREHGDTIREAYANSEKPRKLASRLNKKAETQAKRSATRKEGAERRGGRKAKRKDWDKKLAKKMGTSVAAMLRKYGASQISALFADHPSRPGTAASRLTAKSAGADLDLFKSENLIIDEAVSLETWAESILMD